MLIPVFLDTDDGTSGAWASIQGVTGVVYIDYKEQFPKCN